MDCLIVMEDVSGVADISKKIFNCFKKIWLSLRLCVSCNITFYSKMWQKIISQTNIFNISSASVPHNTV